MNAILHFTAGTNSSLVPSASKISSTSGSSISRYIFGGTLLKFSLVAPICSEKLVAAELLLLSIAFNKEVLDSDSAVFKVTATSTKNETVMNNIGNGDCTIYL